MHPQPPTELARAIVAQVAPTELPLFTAISKAYAENPDRARTRGGRDEPLGFGLADGVSLLTPVILAATDAIVRYLAEDVGKALTHAAIELATKWIWALFHREPDAQPLSQAQIAQIRAIVAEIAQERKVAEPTARQLADATVVQLAGAPTGAS
jgi:hypothetical protein